MSIEERIEEIEERLEATTGESWTVWRGDIAAGEDNWVTSDFVDEADAEFIENCHNDIRTLIDEIQRLYDKHLKMGTQEAIYEDALQRIQAGVVDDPEKEAERALEEAKAIWTGGPNG